MLDLGSTDFNLAVPSVDAALLKSLSTALFDDWEAYVHRSLVLPDYSLFLQVEEGSIKGWGKVGAAAAALYVGIGNYGDFMSGLETISQQLSSTRTYLAEQARNRFSCAEPQAVVRKRGGIPAALQRLFVRVQSGELTAAEASNQAQALLGDEATDAPGLIDALTNALHRCPRHHQQMPLELDEPAEIPPIQGVGIKQQPKAPKRRPPELPPPLHYRVEVWRESKKKRKKTKVTAL